MVVRDACGQMFVVVLVTACGGSSGTMDGDATTGGSVGTSLAEGGSTAEAGDSASGSTTDAPSGTSSDGGVDGTDGSSGGGSSSEPIYGVTIDAIDPLPEIVDALASLHRKPTTRVVFDEFVPAVEYVDAVTEISAVSFVMGELLDSFYVAQYSPAEYADRTDEYLDAMADVVDIWEIGNEINGEWLCAPGADSCTAGQTAEVVEKISSAYQAVKARGGRTALTLYYNEDCWSAPDNEMFTWAEANVPAELKAGLDYVLVSYYEDDCNDLQPDWAAVFAQLAVMFPSASLGIGECGTTNDGAKQEFVQRYYGMGARLSQERFVGGYFWWYFRQDMVPKSQPLWTTLDDALWP